MSHTVFYIVNDNPQTVDPYTLKPFTGKFITSDGRQTDTISGAAMYWQKSRAQATVDKLNRCGPEHYRWYEKVIKNVGTPTQGQYRIVPYTISEGS